jgi:hypothetical protein
MTFWKIVGLITGLAVVTFIVRTCKQAQVPLNDPKIRYNVDDLLLLDDDL